MTEAERLALIRRIFGPAFGWSQSFSVATGHLGIDLFAPIGTPVKSFSGGKVVSVGYNSISGKLIKIATPNGLEEHYLHLSSTIVKTGDVVTPGQVIGAVGDTGQTTGPHLHFSIWDPLKGSSGGFLDPLPFLNGTGITSFQERLKALGIPTDPAHIITEAEAIKIVGLYGFTPGTNFFDDRVKWFSGKTILEAGLGGNTNQNIANDAVDGITGLVDTINDPSFWFKLGAILLGIVLLVKGATTIVNKSGA